MREEIAAQTLKEAAKAEVELLGELRRVAFEQHSQSFRWLTASLLAINGGAAIAVLNSTQIIPDWKIASGASFAAGILAALLIGVLGQRANIKSFLPIQRQMGYWISVAEDGVRDEELEATLAGEATATRRYSIAGQVMGWLSAIAFIGGLVTVAYGLQESVQAGPGAGVINERNQRQLETPKASLRPNSLGEFVGEETSGQNLLVFVDAPGVLSEHRKQVSRNADILSGLGRTAT